MLKDPILDVQFSTQSIRLTEKRQHNKRMTWLWQLFDPRLFIWTLVSDGWRGRGQIKVTNGDGKLTREITACNPSDICDQRLYTKDLSHQRVRQVGFLLALNIPLLGFLCSLETGFAICLGTLSIAITEQVPIGALTGESQAIITPLSGGSSCFRKTLLARLGRIARVHDSHTFVDPATHNSNVITAPFAGSPLASAHGQRSADFLRYSVKSFRSSGDLRGRSPLVSRLRRSEVLLFCKDATAAIKAMAHKKKLSSKT